MAKRRKEPRIINVVKGNYDVGRWINAIDLWMQRGHDLFLGKIWIKMQIADILNNWEAR